MCSAYFFFFLQMASYEDNTGKRRNLRGILITLILMDSQTIGQVIWENVQPLISSLRNSLLIKSSSTRWCLRPLRWCLFQGIKNRSQTIQYHFQQIRRIGKDSLLHGPLWKCGNRTRTVPNYLFLKPVGLNHKNSEGNNLSAPWSLLINPTVITDKSYINKRDRQM